MADLQALMHARKKSGATDEELARALLTARTPVPAAEHATNEDMTMLRRYVEELGGQIEVHAVFADGERFPLRLWASGTAGDALGSVG